MIQKFAKLMTIFKGFVKGKIDLITIISAINVAVNRKRIREETGFRAVDYITSLGIEVRSFDDLIEPTFRMARQYGLSPYDCAYLALGEKEKCDFFTGDKRLFNAVKNQLSWIKWIGDYPNSA